MEMGRPDEAEKQYLLELKNQPDFTPALLNLANLYAAKGRNREAAAQWKHVLAVNPSSQEAREKLARIQPLLQR